MSAHTRDDDLVRHDPTARPPLALATVQQAANIIDRSGLVEQLVAWDKADQKHRGGRPAYLSMRAILILWLILATEQQPTHIRRIEQILRSRLTVDTAAILRITIDNEAAPDALYERARTSTNRLLKLIDNYPLKNRQRRLTKAEYAAELAWREAHADEMERKRQRGLLLTNGLLEATYQLLPARFRPDRASIVVDATRLRAHARGIGLKRLDRMADENLISSEPDFGFYVRNGKHQIVAETSNPKIREYAVEAEFAVLTSNDPKFPHAVPNLVLGYASHIPGKNPVLAARHMVDSILERGHSIEHFVGDRAYMPAGNPEVLQNHLRSHGAKLVMDYPYKQLGIQNQAHGSILVEGSWYCPSMPKHLIDATSNHRRGVRKNDKDKSLSNREKRNRETTSELEWKALIAQRSQYLVRAKESPDERGRVTMMCPAAGNAPTVSCGLKELRDTRVPHRALLPILNTPKAPGKLCTNKSSVTFDVADDGSHGQYYEFGSPDWEANYHHARNNVEAFNAYVKDPATFALAEPGRRRMRGRAAQMLLEVVTLVAANIKIVRDFLLEHDEGEAEAELGITPPAGRTRRSRRSDALTRITQLNRRGKPQTRT